MKLTLLEDINAWHNKKRVLVPKGANVVKISYSKPVYIVQFSEIKFSVHESKVKINDSK